ncbi:MAG: hypothetical protein ACREOW_02530 [Thermodesulfobacteriota bacterium]
MEKIASLVIAMTTQQYHYEESYDIAQDKLRDEESTTSCHLERMREI